MDGGTFVMLNFLLVKGPILAIALYQLWSLRHYPKPPERQERNAPPPSPMGGDRKPLPNKPLPECLVPRPLAAPAPHEERVRELV
ncbi:hypothetical protein [Elioraea rosea]|uniref:hypothetical protein n=1 Tax=Elioraea rosea TaxID=2492390 RepID=UPI001182E215|nr:hypothetical protein [Elioraea rosea]